LALILSASSTPAMSRAWFFVIATGGRVPTNPSRAGRRSHSAITEPALDSSELRFLLAVFG
jgi:hypothetical protein